MKCDRCGGELTKFIGELYPEDRTERHIVSIWICDCWTIFWDVTKKVGFDAQIQNKKKGEEGEFYTTAEEIPTLRGFR